MLTTVSDSGGRFVLPIVRPDAYTLKLALDGFKTLARTEGILPALESSHAIAYTMQLVPTLKAGSVVVVNLSGRGDKDVQTVIDNRGGVPPDPGRYRRR